MKLDHNDANYIAFREYVDDNVKFVINELCGKFTIFTEPILTSTLLRNFENKFKELLPK